MKEIIRVEVNGKVAEISLVTPVATLGIADEVIAMPPLPGPIPPIRLPGIPDIGPRPICIPLCAPACLPSLGLRPICNPDVSVPKPLPKPKP